MKTKRNSSKSRPKFKDKVCPERKTLRLYFLLTFLSGAILSFMVSYILFGGNFRRPAPSILAAYSSPSDDNVPTLAQLLCLPPEKLDQIDIALICYAHACHLMPDSPDFMAHLNQALKQEYEKFQKLESNLKQNKNVKKPTHD